MRGASEAVFRKVAVARLEAQDDATELLRIVRPLDWWVLTALGLVALLGVVWSATTRAAVTVTGQGVLWRPPGATVVVAPHAGRVIRLHVTDDEQVAANAALLDLRRRPNGPPVDDAHERATTAKRSSLRVAAPLAARVLDLAVDVGDDVAAGQVLATLEPSGVALEALLCLDETSAARVRPGQAVRLELRAGPQDRRFVAGQVSSAASPPFGAAGLRRVPGPWAEACAARRGHVRVDLTRSASDGPALRSFTPLAGEIVVAHERPLARVLPWLLESAP